MDIRRTILWVIFAFSIYLLWNNWQIYNNPPAENQTTQAQQDASTEPQPAENGNGIPDTSIPETTSQATGDQAMPEEITPTEPVRSEPSSEQFTIDTDLFKLTFDSTGAQLIRAELHQYTAPNDADHPMVLLDKNADYTYVAQSGIVGAPSGESYPTHLTPFQHKSTYKDDQTGITRITFTAESSDVVVNKIYTIQPDGYAIQVRHEIVNHSDKPIHPSLYLQLTRDDSDPQETSTFYRTFTGPALYSEEDKFQKVKFSDVDKGKAKYTQQTDNGWIGMVQHYFASAWVPPQGVARKNEVLNISDHIYAVRSIQSLGEIAPEAKEHIDANLWVGPQDQKAMGDLAPGLELVVDYGWLTILSKPLFKILTGIHAVIGNWGWAIVILTLLIKLVFYPLSAASYRSMAKMKQVAPRMQALKEQYGDDRQKMNAAMMEMYRNEKINPLGGCLPMLVQIPVFIALYWVLLGSVEMRGAPWILWIHDLSVRDPWFILPAFMMGTMFLQIKLNPTPPDPMQAKVMMIMPLVFGGMMFFFPAGLVLYWCVNNAISIVQQRYIMNKINKEAEKAAQS